MWSLVDWAMLWLFICMVHLTYVIIMSHTSSGVNPYFIVCLNIKERLAPSRHHIWSLTDSIEIRTCNHLVCKQTTIQRNWKPALNHLAKLASDCQCCHLNFRYAPASRKEFLDIQANYRVWIHFETCRWHDNFYHSFSYIYYLPVHIYVL